MALLAPWIAPYDPLAVDLARKLTPPGAAHWLGTDQTGRDIFSRIVWGARPSLAVGMLAVTIGRCGGVASVSPRPSCAACGSRSRCG